MQGIGAGTAGGLAALVRLPDRALPALRGRILHALDREAGQWRLFPWLAVAFGAGILVFFAAADGRPWLPAPLLAGTAGLALAAGLGARPVAMSLAVGFACFGFAAAAWSGSPRPSRRAPSSRP